MLQATKKVMAWQKNWNSMQFILLCVHIPNVKEFKIEFCGLQIHDLQEKYYQTVKHV